MKIPSKLLSFAMAGTTVAAANRQGPRWRVRQKGYRRSTALLDFGARFTGAEDTGPVMEETLRAAVHDMGADAGYIMLMTCDSVLSTEIALSLGTPRDLPLERAIGEGAEGWAAANGETLVLSKRHRGGRSGPDLDFVGESILAAPLLRSRADESDSEVAGVLVVTSFNPRHVFNERDIELARSLAAVATVTLANERRYRELRQSFLSSLKAMARAVEAKLPFMEGHGDRVAEVATMLGRQLEVSHDVLDDLRDGALLHEIGKIGIPDTILLKPGQLTQEEFDCLKLYPVIGYDMCKPLGLGERVLMLIRNHSERLDGTGYPDQFRFGQLPLPLRIMCVADAFDAMSSFRPYRQAMDADARQEQLNRFAGSQFDPVVVESLKDLLAGGHLESLYADHWAKHSKRSSHNDIVAAETVRLDSRLRKPERESLVLADYTDTRSQNSGDAAEPSEQVPDTADSPPALCESESAADQNAQVPICIDEDANDPAATLEQAALDAAAFAAAAIEAAVSEDEQRRAA
jgi:HD-GYP domain-containing protein (c-di-GMP phosphodiesterase class II)